MKKLAQSLILCATLAACGGNNTHGPATGPQTLNPPSDQLREAQPEVDDTGLTPAPKVVTSSLQ